MAWGWGRMPTPTFLKEDDYQFYRGVGVKMAYGLKKIAKMNTARQLQRLGRVHQCSLPPGQSSVGKDEKLIMRISNLSAAAEHRAIDVCCAVVRLGANWPPAAGPPFGATTRNPPVRLFSDQQVTTIRTTLTFNMCTQTAASCTVRLANAALPFNALVLRVTVFTYVAFNSTTSDVVTLGTTFANANEIVSTGMTTHAIGIAPGTLVATGLNATGNGIQPTSSSPGGFDLWLKWTAGANATATAGLASIVIEYVAANDATCSGQVPAGSPGPLGC